MMFSDELYQNHVGIMDEKSSAGIYKFMATIKSSVTST